MNADISKIEYINAEEPRMPLSMHPKKFILWLIMVSVTMMFAAFTSAYIVKQSEGAWYTFDIPAMFWTTSAIILVSSLTMHLAVRAARKDNLPLMRAMLLITTILGLAFLGGQLLGWQDLVQQGVYFVDHPASSFFYVFTGVHGAHVISGVIFLLITAGLAFTYKVHSKSMVTIEMCATFWHFLDGLWLYLFLFLLANQ